MNKQIHNLLMSCKNQKLPYEYRKDGIYAKFGYINNINLTKSYEENPDGILDYLYNILDNDNSSYKMRITTKQVIEDLTK